MLTPTYVLLSRTYLLTPTHSHPISHYSHIAFYTCFFSLFPYSLLPLSFSPFSILYPTSNTYQPIPPVDLKAKKGGFSIPKKLTKKQQKKLDEQHARNKDTYFPMVNDSVMMSAFEQVIFDWVVVILDSRSCYNLTGTPIII